MNPSDQVFDGISDSLQAALDTGNVPLARALVQAARDVIPDTQWQELRQDFETAFGDYE